MQETLLPWATMSTYKSIDEAIKAHDGKRLYRLLPPERVDEGRTIYVPNGLLGILSDFNDSRDGWRHAELRDFLDGFSLGGRLTVSQHPHAKPGHVMLSRVHPPESEIWSFRCLSPPQGMRFLGRFAAKDCFIALDWNYREVLGEDDEWDNAIRDCQTTWRELFGDLPPYQRSHVHEYISSNFEDVPAGPRRKSAKRNV
jgi:hypothetical protein